MKTKAQEWFLLKKNWMDEMSELSNEDFGRLVRSMYYGDTPEGTLKVFYNLLKDEFDRVNEKREEGLAKRREASKKGNLVKTLKVPSGTPNGTRTHTHTQTNTLTSTGTEIGYKNNVYITDEEVVNKLKSIK